MSSDTRNLAFRYSHPAVFLIVVFYFAYVSITAALGPDASAGAANWERKLPMHFTWYACEPNCGGWIGAVGTVTGDTLKSFDEFAHDRDLDDVTIVLDSSGGSVNDAIALGNRWRQIGLRTTVGTVTAMGGRRGVAPQAWCESMCAFLLLSGKVRYVPEQAHVRVHQIWMGSRTEDPKTGTYTARDMMTIERDIGRLTKYAFDMGGTGELLSLSLDVAPWEPLRELSPRELHLTNLVTTDTVADVLPEPSTTGPAVASGTPNSVEDQRVNSPALGKTWPTPKSTKTAEAGVPTGGAAAPPPASR